MTKTCRKCKKEKPISEYFKEKGGKDGLRSACKSCRKDEVNAWNEKVKRDPTYLDKNRKRTRLNHIYKKHGITEQQYNDLFFKQNGCCAVCHRHQTEISKTLCVDHCHKTGKIRGLLCGNCNTAAGLLKDNLNIMKNLINYIEINK